MFVFFLSLMFAFSVNLFFQSRVHDVFGPLLFSNLNSHVSTVQWREAAPLEKQTLAEKGALANFLGKDRNREEPAQQSSEGRWFEPQRRQESEKQPAGKQEQADVWYQAGQHQPGHERYWFFFPFFGLCLLWNFYIKAAFTLFCLRFFRLVLNRISSPPHCVKCSANVDDPLQDFGHVGTIDGCSRFHIWCSVLRHGLLRSALLCVENAQSLPRPKPVFPPRCATAQYYQNIHAVKSHSRALATLQIWK